MITRERYSDDRVAADARQMDMLAHDALLDWIGTWDVRTLITLTFGGSNDPLIGATLRRMRSYLSTLAGRSVGAVERGSLGRLHIHIASETCVHGVPDWPYGFKNVKITTKGSRKVGEYVVKYVLKDREAGEVPAGSYNVNGGEPVNECYLCKPVINK